jgi:hypothetical protein
VGSKAFGGLHRRLKEKTAESRWFETTGQAPFGRAKAAYWKINQTSITPRRVLVATRKSQETVSRCSTHPTRWKIESTALLQPAYGICSERRWP